MIKQLDMVGQPCPIPVVQARRALQAGDGTVIVTVDNEVAVQNLRKMADGDGHAFAFEPLSGGHFRVILGAGNAVDIDRTESWPGPSALLIARSTFGDGDPALGAMLMKGFIFAQSELPSPPADILFVNGGAKLTTAGATTVPDLLALQAKGVRIWTCGTCANFYGITDALAVGQITDMLHIARILAGAEKVVTV